MRNDAGPARSDQAPVVAATATAADGHPMAPRSFRITGVERESSGVVSLAVEADAEGDGAPAPEPGQFCMLSIPGVGEAPISVSGCPVDDGALRFTVRRAGPVTRALCAAEPGDAVGVRGPYGVGWPIDAVAGRDVLVVGGGIGFAPLRPVVRRALAGGSSDRIAVAVGARRPEDVLFRDELTVWARRGVRVAVTVDAAAPGWRGDVGVVTRLLDRATVDPARTVAFVCGPEVMMRVVARRLSELGVEPAAVFVSLERNMHCGIGHCGHCQIGPAFVCLDGPVLSWAVAGPLLEVRRW